LINDYLRGRVHIAGHRGVAFWRLDNFVAHQRSDSRIRRWCRINRLELELSAEVLQLSSLVRRAQSVAQPGVDEGKETVEDVARDFGKDQDNFLLGHIAAEVAVDCKQLGEEAAGRYLKESMLHNKSYLILRFDALKTLFNPTSFVCRHL
jgi:hypothetical protein